MESGQATWTFSGWSCNPASLLSSLDNWHSALHPSLWHVYLQTHLPAFNLFRRQVAFWSVILILPSGSPTLTQFWLLGFPICNRIVHFPITQCQLGIWKKQHNSSADAGFSSKSGLKLSNFWQNCSQTITAFLPTRRGKSLVFLRETLWMAVCSQWTTPMQT